MHHWLQQNWTRLNEPVVQIVRVTGCFRAEDAYTQELYAGFEP